MSLEERNQIVPQMREYDQIGDQWVPYLMRADGAMRNFGSVHTDRWGMRHTVRPNGTVLTADALSEQQTCNVVVGSSAVFGVGSSADAHTIPSYLVRDTHEDWLNFGGRAYNSTQELIRLMLHLPQKLRNIVVFSGVNNITLAFLSSSTSPVYNSFFSQTAFERAMTNPAPEYIGVRQAVIRLLKEVHHRFSSRKSASTRETLDDSYSNVITCFERDLCALKYLADGMGARLVFAMQPLATWINKTLSDEEHQIFDLLDSMAGDWSVLASRILNIRDRYFEDMSRLCRIAGVEFYNLNLAPEFQTSEWLFVDRVHLTDRGCELAAKLLETEFSL